MRVDPLPPLEVGGFAQVERVSYVEQCSADLSYYLLADTAPRSVLRVLREQMVRIEGGSLTLAIIGSSHFLEFEAGGTVMCELFACPTGGMAGLECVHRLSDGATWKSRRREKGLAYEFHTWCEPCSRQQFAAESLRLRDTAERRLHYSFPKSREAESAVTCLEWQTHDTVAMVSTYHTFPGELAIVHTRSVIDFTEAVARR
jgi:hypothetical protein